ncbi:hypothetical protein HanRHA438_Chr12g0566811 [Helianthus annuus]|nr:hypothetical protein HanRHA438_Chr12g0566811 [Helianthus annuus]
MGKKKKTPPPKVYNTRSTTKEEVAVIKEQVASWWDKLISGNVESSGAVEKKDEVSTVEKTGECGLSKSVSTVPTVSASDYSSEKVASSIVGSSEKMVTSESSGSSYTVAGDESVNSSPSVVKKPDESSIRNPKFASVFDVLDYNKRNLSIPTKSSSPMNMCASGNSEFDVWMKRREHFMVAAGVKTSENLSGSSSRIIDKFCGNDVTSAGNDGDCRKAAVKADNLKNPNDSCPLDDVANGQMECSVVGLNHVATELENIAKVGSAVDLDQVNSPSGVSPVDGESRLAYDAPKRNEAGVFEVYGYFIGANMPFRVVKENVIKMWHRYELKSINVNRGGYFFFKFDHEEGMLQVLERNPWLIDNVPLVLQMWDPNVVLRKPNPKTVPVWVAIKDLPLSLWNGGNIGEVVSYVGRPLMLDQTTLKRCELKEGPLNFARVLVVASASNGLPDKVKINLPKCNGVPGKSYFLDLSYKWKPPCCSFCKVFGHVDDKCEFKKDNGPTSVLKNQRLSNDKLAVDVENFRDDEFVDVVRKSKAQNKGKQPVLASQKN